jgi:subfamily B ATP-binding cassette protein MsbA
LGGITAFLEGIGLSFIYPILEVAQSDGQISQTNGILGRFLDVYEFLGIPFSLEFLILGVATAMTVRYSLSFMLAWLRVILQQTYEKTLRTQAFESALAARISYFDTEGSDDILNAIITETNRSSTVINSSVQMTEALFLSGVYFSVMFYIAPEMTVYAFVLLGGITYVLRHVVEPAYTVGSRVAEANELVQQSVQAGTQGIRDVKLFGLSEELFDSFTDSIQQYTRSTIDLKRN